MLSLFVCIFLFYEIMAAKFWLFSFRTAYIFFSLIFPRMSRRLHNNSWTRDKKLKIVEGLREPRGQ